MEAPMTALPPERFLDGESRRVPTQGGPPGREGREDRGATPERKASRRPKAPADPLARGRPRGPDSTEARAETPPHGEPEATPEPRPLRRHWEKDTRYYEVHVEPDLWGHWVLTRVWGRRGTALGQVRRIPCGDYAEALAKLAAVARQRARRGYAPV
jgi:predicted DNA-binding WGR domain protein